MDPEYSEIERLLTSIEESLRGANSNEFLSTLFATLVGASIAGLFSFLIFHRERAERYEVALDEAATRVMKELHLYGQDYRRFISALTEAAADYASPPSVNWARTRPTEPDRADLDVALDVLLVKARRGDRQIADLIKRTVYELTFTQNAEWLVREYHTVRRVVAAWRAKRRSKGETLASLTRINSRRAMIQDGVADEDIPAAPEPYERIASEA